MHIRKKPVSILRAEISIPRFFDNCKSRENENRSSQGSNSTPLVLTLTLKIRLVGTLRNKKTGSRRRNVNKEDLVAEDKPRLVSSLGPSCRCMEHRRGRGKWLKWSDDVILVRSLVLWLAI